MNDNNPNKYFPVLINLERIPCLVVGGGEIAYQKVKSLLEFNADITVLSPDLNTKLEQLFSRNEINYFKDYYSSKYLRDYRVVFSATNKKSVNKRIQSDCERKGIFLNVVDDPELCDFILPANIINGNLTISISSQGKAPFYTRHLKSVLRHQISATEGDVLNLAGEFRYMVFSDSKFESQENKQEAFAAFNNINWHEILKEKGTEGAGQVMEDLFIKLKEKF